MTDPGPRPDLRQGHVEVICGPMFSGKTEELIRRLRRAQIARQRVVVFKPKIDVRYDEVEIVSHSSLRLRSIPIATAPEIDVHLAREDARPDVVGVDEAQFFDIDVVPVVERLADKGVRVVVAGLDQDFLGKPFGPIPHLLCVAEVVTKQLAVCMVCGAPAGRSQRVNPDAHKLTRDQASNPAAFAQVLVAAGDAYEARCRRCFTYGIDTPSRRAEHS
jgi:thymidine kinase